MDIEVVSINDRFKPIKMVVTIKSADELTDLWHRLNITSHEMSKIESGELRVNQSGCVSLRNLWLVIDNAMKERGLRDRFVKEL